jgi:hypothetical protein
MPVRRSFCFFGKKSENFPVFGTINPPCPPEQHENHEKSESVFPAFASRKGFSVFGTDV